MKSEEKEKRGEKVVGGEKSVGKVRDVFPGVLNKGERGVFFGEENGKDGKNGVGKRAWSVVEWQRERVKG